MNYNENEHIFISFQGLQILIKKKIKQILYILCIYIIHIRKGFKFQSNFLPVIFEIKGRESKKSNCVNLEIKNKTIFWEGLK